MYKFIMTSARANPKIFSEYHIRNKQKVEIGYIRLVSYLRSDSLYHIEYSLIDEWQGKGIMSKELPKYLKHLKKHGYTRLVAVVKENNIASIKLLKKNNFVFITKIRDTYSYLIDLSFPVEKLKKMQEIVAKEFTTHNF